MCRSGNTRACGAELAAEKAAAAEAATAGAAVELDNSTLHPDLQTIIDRWPDLPDAVKAGIVAMVRSCGE